MPQQYPGVDDDGQYYAPLVWNKDAGVWERFDGHMGHSRLQTKFVSAVSLGTSIFTLSATQKAYITFLQMQPMTRGKTFATIHLVASGAAALTLMKVMLQQMTFGNVTNRVPAFQNLYRAGDQAGNLPVMAVGSGKTLVLKSRPNAITSVATVSWYVVTTTGDK